MRVGERIETGKPVIIINRSHASRSCRRRGVDRENGGIKGEVVD
jgi:hypothetical protein